jgi:hypothetical protein
MEDYQGSDVMTLLQAKAEETMLPSRLFNLVWKAVIETAIVEPVGSPLLISPAYQLR